MQDALQRSCHAVPTQRVRACEDVTYCFRKSRDTCEFATIDDELVSLHKEEGKQNSGHSVYPPCDVLELHTLVEVGTHCGAIVLMGHSYHKNRSVLIKRYVHEGASWLMPQSVRRQIEVYFQLNCRLHSTNGAERKQLKALQQCFDIQIQSAQTQFYFKYYDMEFAKQIRYTTPKFFVLQKAIELILAVRTLHQTAKIAHRDIKSQNICFTRHSRLVLIDFDSSVVVPNVSDQFRKTLPVCTLSTTPPEHFLPRDEVTKEYPEYDAFAGDWWAVGCVIAQMWLGEELFPFVVSRLHADLMETHYKNLCSFCTELALRTISTDHLLVKALRRTVILPDVIALLKGLFSLDPTMRRQSVDVFLSSDFVAQATNATF